MDKYIGIDVPAASCTIAVVDARGKQTGSHVVATNGQEIVECLLEGPMPSRGLTRIGPGSTMVFPCLPASTLTDPA
jgi:hypothetical protein